MRYSSILGGGGLSKSVMGLTSSGLLLLTSIVNRGVSAGAGDGNSYGSNILFLVYHYVVKLFRGGWCRSNGFGPLAIGSIVLGACSTVAAAKEIFTVSKKE